MVGDTPRDRGPVGRERRRHRPSEVLCARATGYERPGVGGSFKLCTRSRDGGVVRPPARHPLYPDRTVGVSGRVGPQRGRRVEVSCQLLVDFCHLMSSHTQNTIIPYFSSSVVLASQRSNHVPDHETVPQAPTSERYRHRRHRRHRRRTCSHDADKAGLGRADSGF